MPLKSFKLIEFLLFFLIIACSANTGVEEFNRIGEQSDASAAETPEASPFVLGIGDEIEIISNNSQGQIAIAADYTRYVLGRGFAEKILVEPIKQAKKQS